MNREQTLSNVRGAKYIFILVLFLAACAPKEDITKRALLNKPPNYLLSRIQDPSKNVQWFSAKAATEVDQNGKMNSFKSNFKLRRDSLIWASLSPALGIEIVRAIVSQDSVKFINKLDDEFFTGALQDLTARTNTEISFDQLQSLLLGSALEFDPKEKYKSSVEGYRYVLTSKAKKKYIKVAEQKETMKDSSLTYRPGLKEKHVERILEKNEEKLVVRKYFISPETFLITEVEIFDLGHEQLLEIRYSEYLEVEGVLLPHHLEFLATDGKNTVRVSMDLSKVKVDQPQSMPFKIPEKYERIY